MKNEPLVIVCWVFKFGTSPESSIDQNERLEGSLKRIIFNYQVKRDRERSINKKEKRGEKER